MSPTIATILLEPAAGDPHGLLRDGPCGARPPTMRRDYCDIGECGWTDWTQDGAIFCPQCGNRTDRRKRSRALVLAHEGRPVPDGMDRWYRVLNRVRPRNKYHPPVRWDDTMDEVLLFFRAGHMRSDFGTFHLLDATGRDITAAIMENA